MSERSRLRLGALISGVVLLAAACTTAVDMETTTTGGIDTTSSLPVPASSSTAADEGLDLTGVTFVFHGPEGMRLDDGTEVWTTEPFPAQVSRDREGGLVFTDSRGLWWFPAGSAEPTLVSSGVAELISAFPGDTGPVAMVWDGEPEYVRLSDGESVSAPDGAQVEISPDAPWARKLTAVNGLSVWVTDPDVEWDAEGQPAGIRQPAHLVVADGEEVILDVAVGTLDQAWATIHDFDGRMLIFSRGPYEPAMPEESFFLIDLATGEVTHSFVAAGTRVTLTTGDTEWSGQVQAPELEDAEESS